MTHTNEQTPAVNFKYNGKTYTCYDTFYKEVIEHHTLENFYNGVIGDNYIHLLNTDYNFYNLVVKDNIQSLYDLVDVLEGKKDIEDTVWKLLTLREIHKTYAPSSISYRLILNRINSGYSAEEAFRELTEKR